MRPHNGKSGYTLLEMMIAVTVFVLVVAQLLGVFIGFQRLIRNTLTESELALTTRQMRDRLLFKARPDAGTHFSAGLLSAPARDRNNRLLTRDESAHAIDYSSIAATIPYVDTANGYDGKYPSSQFAIGSLWNNVKRRNDMMLVDQKDPGSAGWLFPMHHTLGWDWSQWNDQEQDGSAFADRQLFNDTEGRRYRLTIRYVYGGVERREPVTIPVFGTVQ